jgi:hypothetical protein
MAPLLCAGIATGRVGWGFRLTWIVFDYDVPTPAGADRKHHDTGSSTVHNKPF